MIIPRDLPKHECLQAFAELLPGVDASAVEASIVLVRVAGDILARIETALSAHGLSQARFTVLILLMKRVPTDGPCMASIADDRLLDSAVATPSELAEECGVTRATITGLLDGLEREGLILRERPALNEQGSTLTDRRHVRVRLTAKAAGLMAKVMPECLALHSSLLCGIEAHERASLVATLLKLRANMFAGTAAAHATTDQG